MRFDYIEIGSSCFKTLAEAYAKDDNIVGLSIEPVTDYIEQLKKYCSDSKNKHFLECAVVSSERASKSDYLDFFYMTLDTVLRNKNIQLAGIGSISKESTEKIGKRSSERCRVKCLSFETVIENYNISKLGFLKIDAEGCDYEILMDVAKLLQKKVLSIDAIMFEGHPFLKQDQMNNIVNNFCSKSHDYKIIDPGGGRNFLLCKPSENPDQYFQISFKYIKKNRWLDIMKKDKKSQKHR